MLIEKRISILGYWDSLCSNSPYYKNNFYYKDGLVYPKFNLNATAKFNGFQIIKEELLLFGYLNRINGKIIINTQKTQKTRDSY